MIGNLINTWRGLSTLALVLLLAAPARALTLEQAIELGQERSLRLQSTRIDRERINGQIREAWSNALPQVDALAAYQRYWKPSVVFFPNPATGEIMPLSLQQDNNAIGEVTLNQPLFTFGRVSNGLKAAYAARSANDHLQKNTHRDLELNIARQFWTVLLLQDVVDARRASLAVSDSNLVRMHRLRDLGLSSDYDVLRVQVQADNQIPALQQAENDLHLATLALWELLGVPLDTTLNVEGQLADYSPVLEADTSVQRVLARDDLEALRDVSRVNKYVYGIYKSQNLPVLAGQVKYSWQWSNDAWAINPRNNASSVYGGLSLSIPVWNSGRVSGQAQQHKADWRQAQLNLVQAERGALLQYEAAVRSYQTASASEEAAGRAVEQAGQARAIAQTKLAQGLATPLEMDAAQLDELVARVSLAQARFNRLVAASEARLALGISPYTKP